MSTSGSGSREAFELALRPGRRPLARASLGGNYICRV